MMLFSVVYCVSIELSCLRGVGLGKEHLPACFAAFRRGDSTAIHALTGECPGIFSG